MSFCFQFLACDPPDTYRCRGLEAFDINPPVLTQTVRMTYLGACHPGTTDNLGLQDIELMGYPGNFLAINVQI